MGRSSVMFKLSAALCGVALFALSIFALPQTAVAETSGNGWSFDDSTDALTITSNYGTTAWRNDVSNKARVKTVEISERVTSIGDYAFHNCTSLESVAFTEGSQCASVGYCAFDGCPSLKRVDYAGDLAGWLGINFGDGSNPCRYGADLYLRGEKLDDAVIPASVTSIDRYAFEGCTSLESVAFAEGSKCESIGDYAFYGCAALASVGIPDTVTSIGGLAFEGCKSLKRVYVDDLASYLSIEGGWNLYGKGELYVGGKPLVDAVIPASVTSIGEYAFSHCTSLASVAFAEGSQCESIGYSAFYDCTSLASIDIPSSVASIGEYAFFDCTSLESVSFAVGSKCESIGYSAFYDCTSLASIDIPSSVASIGDRAFAGTVQIKCAAGSAAEAWAKANGNKVEVTGGSAADPDPAPAHTHSWKTVKGYAAKIGIVGKTDGAKCACGVWKTKQSTIAAKNPAPVKLTKLVRGKKLFTAKWAKSTSANATGYQVRYSLKKSMAKSKTVTVKGYKVTSKKIKKLKSGKKYYVQVRVYKVVNGKKWYSTWSAKKYVKVA